VLSLLSRTLGVGDVAFNNYVCNRLLFRFTRLTHSRSLTGLIAEKSWSTRSIDYVGEAKMSFVCSMEGAAQALYVFTCVRLSIYCVGEAKMSFVCSIEGAWHSFAKRIYMRHGLAFIALEKQRCLSCAGSGPWRERRCWHKLMLQS